MGSYRKWTSEGWKDYYAPDTNGHTTEHSSSESHSSRPSRSSGTRKKQTKSKPKPKPKKAAPKKATKTTQQDTVVITDKQFFLEGRMKILPDVTVTSNTVIQTEGLGKLLDTKYYVESVLHSWTREGYQVELEVKTDTFSEYKYTPRKPSSGRKTPKKPVQPKQKYHVVKRGESLLTIARKYYNKSALWTRIYNANKGIIKNPNKIYPGMRLLIP